MKCYYLLYMEDTKTSSATRVDLFQEKSEAQKAMETAYAETILRLGFDTSICNETHCCGCNRSAAIIMDGEDNYSWSVGVREMPVLAAVSETAEMAHMQ